MKGLAIAVPVAVAWIISGCQCTQVLNVALNVFSGIQWLVKQLPLEEGGSVAGSTVDGIPTFGQHQQGRPEEWSDAQLCATELSNKLASAIASDDQFSQRTNYVAGNWRDPRAASLLNLAVGCVPEIFDKKMAKIVCRASLPDTEEKREVFARYWAYFPDTDADGALAEEHEYRLERLNNNSCPPPFLKVIFDQGNGIKLFSPFHPAHSHFDVHFRRPGSQSSCRLILDPRPKKNGPEPLSNLSENNPVLFHRLVSDIFLPKVEGLPAVMPKQVADVGNVRSHLAGLAEFIPFYQSGQHHSYYMVGVDESNACNSQGSASQVPLSLLANRIVSCIEDAIRLLDTKHSPFYACDHGLPVWSRHPLCPPTSSCYDSGMCERMLMCGDGVWLDVRGQNRVEAAGLVVKNWTTSTSIPETIDSVTGKAYKYDRGTQAFFDFPNQSRRNKLDDDGIVWHKLQISSGSSTLLALLLHHPPPQSSSQDKAGSVRRAGHSREAMAGLDAVSVEPGLCLRASMADYSIGSFSLGSSSEDDLNSSRRTEDSRGFSYPIQQMYSFSSSSSGSEESKDHSASRQEDLSRSRSSIPSVPSTLSIPSVLSIPPMLALPQADSPNPYASRQNVKRAAVQRGKQAQPTTSMWGAINIQDNYSSSK